MFFKNEIKCLIKSVETGSIFYTKSRSVKMQWKRKKHAMNCIILKSQG